MPCQYSPPSKEGSFRVEASLERRFRRPNESLHRGRGSHGALTLREIESAGPAVSAPPGGWGVMLGFSRIGPSIRRSPEVQRAGLGLVVAFVVRVVVGFVVRLVVGLVVGHGVVVRLGHHRLGVADERASTSPPEPVAAM